MKTFELKVRLDKKLEIESTNDGFGGLELLGILSWKQKDIINQIEGKVEPDSVKRNFIEDE